MLSGPHLFNFLEIAAQLRSAGDLLQVQDAAELQEQLQRLFAEPQQAAQMAMAGLANEGLPL